MNKQGGDSLGHSWLRKVMAVVLGFHSPALRARPRPHRGRSRIAALENPEMARRPLGAVSLR